MFEKNPVDFWVRRLGFVVDEFGFFPAVPGMDGAGVVEEIGEDVQGWAVGDRAHVVYCFSEDEVTLTLRCLAGYFQVTGTRTAERCSNTLSRTPLELPR